jgi:polyphosphate kinase
LITPIEEPRLQERLIQILEHALADNRLAWELHEDGRYTLRRPESGDKERNFHKMLMKEAKRRAA